MYAPLYAPVRRTTGRKHQTRRRRQMTRYGLMTAAGIALLAGLAAGTAIAQQPTPTAPVPYFVGNRLGMPINPAADGAFNAMSENVKVYGSVYSAESCSYDPVR